MRLAHRPKTLGRHTLTTTPETLPDTEDCPGCAAKQQAIDRLRTTLDAVRILAGKADDYASEFDTEPLSGTQDS